MTHFKVGDWVVRKPAYRDSHPYWLEHQDTPMQVHSVRSSSDIRFEGQAASWIGEFFDLSPPSSVDLGEWL